MHEYRDELQRLQRLEFLHNDFTSLVAAHQAPKPPTNQAIPTQVPDPNDQSPNSYYRHKQTYKLPGNATLDSIISRRDDLGRQLESQRRKTDALSRPLVQSIHLSIGNQSHLPEPFLQGLLATCAIHRLNPRALARPVLSFLMQYFKRPWLVRRLVGSVIACSRALPPSLSSELLVNVDNPSESAVWAEIARDSKGYVIPIFSNNVHEARGYNRLASMARGTFLIILQDDELLEAPFTWIEKMVSLFESRPLVAVIGFKNYNLAFGEGNNNYGAHFIDGRTRVPSLFTQSVDYSPFAMRKTAWVSVGRIDETSSDQGECGIWSDWELCTRLWAAGWQVMAMPDQAIRKPDDSGHHSGTHRVETGDRCWGRQAGSASGTYFKKFGQWNGPFLTALARRAKELNAREMVVRDRESFKARCPYGWSPYGSGCAGMDWNYTALT